MHILQQSDIHTDTTTIPTSVNIEEEIQNSQSANDIECGKNVTRINVFFLLFTLLSGVTEYWLKPGSYIYYYFLHLVCGVAEACSLNKYFSIAQLLSCICYDLSYLSTLETDDQTIAAEAKKLAYDLDTPRPYPDKNDDVAGEICVDMLGGYRALISAIKIYEDRDQLINFNYNELLFSAAEIHTLATTYKSDVDEVICRIANAIYQVACNGACVRLLAQDEQDGNWVGLEEFMDVVNSANILSGNGPIWEIAPGKMQINFIKLLFLSTNGEKNFKYRLDDGGSGKEAYLHIWLEP